ncbi:AcrR family transcriptional regulator [Amycolatopsis bartoniae]|uniref:TetR family transcriptional regulator n=1 Tax=Amycolatopsis bartoniae TaxID=941986 RepID=A0A8H9J2Y7_9PSEU|nr:TetR/AcrR family transcriptional regulator [Amycolatopsis bartoniae]MBB2937283.1 AcrR family transcriptional regulator [Amycolatopsis bartoniae]TVT07925.1 TetR/AcrR family transcriptional regulator [Amycolatopsis bartoniae]GHF77881.1 TetR family transcriptional regulator [Amycolatopsis bartoniae]
MKRKEKAAETEAALKEAAKRLFAERGYLNTKITDITAAAGRAAGSFYNHFGSKEELLEALLKDMSASSDETAREAEHKSDFSDPDAVRWHVVAYLRFYEENAPTLLAMQQAALVNEEFAERFARFGEVERSDLLSHLTGLDLPAPPEVSVAMMYSLVDSFMRLAPAGLSEEDTVEALTRFAYRGLTGKDY